jgi:hypothetical protein
LIRGLVDEEHLNSKTRGNQKIGKWQKKSRKPNFPCQIFLAKFSFVFGFFLAFSVFSDFLLFSNRGVLRRPTLLSKNERIVDTQISVEELKKTGKVEKRHRNQQKKGTFFDSTGATAEHP